MHKCLWKDAFASEKMYYALTNAVQIETEILRILKKEKKCMGNISRKGNTFKDFLMLHSCNKFLEYLVNLVCQKVIRISKSDTDRNNVTF